MVALWKWMTQRRKVGYQILGLVMINLVVFVIILWLSPFTEEHRVILPSTVDLGIVHGDVPRVTEVEIFNPSSLPVRCLGATHGCGFGCYQPLGLPKTIPPGKSVKIAISYKPPVLETLVQRGITERIVTDEMTFYFDDKRSSQQLVQIRCEIGD